MNVNNGIVRTVIDKTDYFIHGERTNFVIEPNDELTEGLDDKESRALLDKIKISTKSKSRAIRTYLGGNCVTCYEIPKYKISYNGGDVNLVDFYCDRCFEKHKSKLRLRLEDMNFG